MKPSWDDAPEWAGWLAMDSDGAWSWHELEPAVNAIGVWSNQGRIAESNIDGWSLTREPRP